MLFPALIACGLAGLTALFIVSPAPLFEDASQSDYARKTFALRKKVLAGLVPDGTTLTRQQLAMCDGTNPRLPILMSLANQVFDVTAGRYYYSKAADNAAYSVFAGRDASYHFFNLEEDMDKTWCGERDWDNLSDDKKKALEDWLAFYRKSDLYFQVGVLSNQDDPYCRRGADDTEEPYVHPDDEALYELHHPDNPNLQAGPRPDHGDHDHEEL